MAKESAISKWKPKKSEQLVYSDGKLFMINFDEIFEKRKYVIYNKFILKKESYENQLDDICKYINYFIKFYDTNEELIPAYFKIKYALDKKKMFTKDNMDAYIGFIYEVIFTDSMVRNIFKAVEENYFDDIEAGNSYKQEVEHLESLEFTNQHIKILLRISLGMKIICPLIFHYLSINMIKLDKESDILYYFYKPLFAIFQEDVDIYNKLFVYVKSKVSESKRHNEPIFDQRDILGIDEYSVINMFIRRVLISENIVKYKFSEHWVEKQKKYKENIVGFNKTVIKFQLSYFIREQHKKTLAEVTNTKDSEGLSGQEKMEMNMKKKDEGIIILSSINVISTIKYMKELIDVEVTDEEIEYYVANHHPHPLQIDLMGKFYSRYFGGYRDLNTLDRHQYIELLLLLKKKLILDSGLRLDGETCTEKAKLPYVLSGNIGDKINTRLVKNSKFISKLEMNYIYQDLKNNKYKHICEVNPNFIISKISPFINTEFTYVTYEQPELLGKKIEYTEDKITDELLFFFKNT